MRTPSRSATGPSSHGSPMERKGPTVWLGVTRLRSPVLASPDLRSTSLMVERRRVAAAQHDVEFVGERPVVLAGVDREAADHALAEVGVAHGVEDGVVGEQRVAG